MGKYQDKLTEAQVQELTEKSWNLELVISGAAIFMTTLLPDGIKWLYVYYYQYLTPSTASDAIMFPTLAYSFFIVIAYLLTAFFVVHFAMRAFWAGLIGLHAAFPDGIRYEQLPNMTDELRQMTHERYGQLEGFIVRLDKWTNQVFAIAFSVTIFGVSIGIIYLISMLILLAAHALGGEKATDFVRMMLSVMFMAYSLTIVLMGTYIKKKPNANEKLRRLHARLAMSMSTIVSFFGNSGQYITLTFSSNVPTRRFYTVLSIASIAVMGLAMSVFMGKVAELKGRPATFFRNIRTIGSDRYYLNANKYDDQWQPGVLPQTVTLPTDIISDGYLKVFVNITQALDSEIGKNFVQPNISEDLPRHEYRRLHDSLEIGYISRHFQIKLNNKPLPAPEWMFHEKPLTGSNGVIAYIPLQGFPVGRYFVTVEMPSATKPDSLIQLGQVPFWYDPK